MQQCWEDACTDSLQCSDVGSGVTKFCNFEHPNRSPPSGYCEECSGIENCAEYGSENQKGELWEEHCKKVCEG